MENDNQNKKDENLSSLDEKAKKIIQEQIAEAQKQKEKSEKEKK